MTNVDIEPSNRVTRDDGEWAESGLDYILPDYISPSNPDVAIRRFIRLVPSSRLVSVIHKPLYNQPGRAFGREKIVARGFNGVRVDETTIEYTPLGKKLN